jgi:hypothetical protein
MALLYSFPTACRKAYHTYICAFPDNHWKLATINQVEIGSECDITGEKCTLLTVHLWI